MQVAFKNDRQQKFFESSSQLAQKYGAENARKIVKRINELRAIPTLAKMPPIAHVHPLHNDRKGTFATSIKEPYRLVFKPLDSSITDPSQIISIIILEVTDYH